MLCKIPKQAYQKISFIFVIVRIFFIMVVLMMIQISKAKAQDLVLKDMYITGEETYSTSDSITAGPNFTISSTGTVTLEAGGTITLVPDFIVLEGGVLYALTGVANNIEIQEELNHPDYFVLNQNYPNPFNPLTTIKYHLPKSISVSIKIHDLLGKEVETLISEYRYAGEHQIEWNAKDYPSGIYLYRLEAGDFVETKKLILQK